MAANVFWKTLGQTIAAFLVFGILMIVLMQCARDQVRSHKMEPQQAQTSQQAQTTVSGATHGCAEGVEYNPSTRQCENPAFTPRFAPSRAMTIDDLTFQEQQLVHNACAAYHAHGNVAAWRACTNRAIKELTAGRRVRY